MTALLKPGMRMLRGPFDSTGSQARFLNEKGFAKSAGRRILIQRKEAMKIEIEIDYGDSTKCAEHRVSSCYELLGSVLDALTARKILEEATAGTRATLAREIAALDKRVEKSAARARNQGIRIS